MNNDLNTKVNDNKIIDPKTGSGYVSASDNNMDASIGIVLLVIVVVIIGGIYLLFTNSEGIWDSIQDKLIEFSENMEEEDTYYEEDEDEYIESEDSTVTPGNIGLKNILPSNVPTLSNGKRIVVVVGREDSTEVSTQLQQLRSIMNQYKETMYYIDTTNILSTGDNPQVYNQFEYIMLGYISGDGEFVDYFKNYTTLGKPIILIVNGNRIEDVVEGFTTGNDLVDFFDRNSITRR